MVDKAKTEKKTISTGRRIGLKNKAQVSITVNDEDRAISGMWETVKKYYSNKKIPAAQTARKVLLTGLLAELEAITFAANIEAEKELDRRQARLFE